MGKMNWTEKKVLITGASGIVGSWLTKRLLELGAEVTIYLRDFVPRSYLIDSGALNRVNAVNGKLEDYFNVERTLNEYEIDTVFHLGAQTIVETANRSPLGTFESNIKGTWTILEACRNSKLVTNTIVASSDKAYGEQKQLPYTEDMPLIGKHPYDVSKSCSDLIAQSYHDTYNMPIAIARCGNVFGGGDLNFNRIVPGTIKSFLENKSPIIRSDGMYKRDYFYVKDAAESYITLAENASRKGVKGNSFNFGNEKPLAVLDIVGKIAKIMSKQSIKPKILNIAKNEIKNQYLSCVKAKKQLNWKPKYTIDKGLRETIDWYKNFFKK